jgi:hypothetical protein
LQSHHKFYLGVVLKHVHGARPVDVV